MAVVVVSVKGVVCINVGEGSVVVLVVVKVV